MAVSIDLCSYPNIPLTKLLKPLDNDDNIPSLLGCCCCGPENPGCCGRNCCDESPAGRGNGRSPS